MTTVLFDGFEDWRTHCERTGEPAWLPVLCYEQTQKNKTEDEIWAGVERAWAVMQDAVSTGLTRDLVSVSGMINNGAKKVFQCPVNVLDDSFRLLVARTLAAKELNSCMGRVVAAPTAGASGILPGILTHLQHTHGLPARTLHECLLVAAGVGLVIERRASIAGAVGGCQAETGTAAAMGAAAIVLALGGSVRQQHEAVAITIMDMLGLICDPIAGLVEVPCVQRNASAAVIAYAAAQIAIAGYEVGLPTDEVVDVMGEVGQSMDVRYKETALGGLAATPTGKAIARRILKHSAAIVEDDHRDD